MNNKYKDIIEKYNSFPLEKRAFLNFVIKSTKYLGNLGKNFNWGKKLVSFSKDLSRVSRGGKDFSKGVDFLKNYSSFSFTKDPVSGVIKYRHAPKNEGFIQNRIGDAVDYISRLGKGINKDTGLLEGSKKLLKNFWEAEKELWFNQTYRTVNTKKLSPFANAMGIENRVVGKKLVTNAPLPNRTIYGTAGRNTVIVKKRMVPRALAYSFTPTGTVGFGLATGDNLRASATDAVLWTPVLRPVGEVKMFTDMV